MINLDEVDVEEVEGPKKPETIRDSVRVNITNLHGIRLFLPKAICDDLDWVDGQGMSVKYAEKDDRGYLVLEHKPGATLFQIKRHGREGSRTLTIRVAKPKFCPELIHPQVECDYEIRHEPGQKETMIIQLPDWKAMAEEIENSNEEEENDPDDS